MEIDVSLLPGIITGTHFLTARQWCDTKTQHSGEGFDATICISD